PPLPPLPPLPTPPLPGHTPPPSAAPTFTIPPLPTPTLLLGPGGASLAGDQLINLISGWGWL
ncbi:MAG: hypothetical protein ACRENL_11630, partial [Candidatus Dormibacteria bacterium]